MKKIILIGCGNIGSRHLQALVQLDETIEIEIVENSITSVTLAKSRLNEITYNKNTHKIKWHNNFDTLSNSGDLVIVATLSTGRVKIIESLLDLGYKKFLVEKLVCQSIEEYDHLLDLMKKFRAKGWVNTRCRYFKSYRKIKEFFKNSKTIHLTMYSGDTGLATGAIHYLDLFSWLLDDTNIKLNGKFLDKKIHSNKRGENLLEFAGTIIGTAKNNSLVSISRSILLGKIDLKKGIIVRKKFINNIINDHKIIKSIKNYSLSPNESQLIPKAISQKNLKILELACDQRAKSILQIRRRTK